MRQAIVLALILVALIWASGAVSAVSEDDVAGWMFGSALLIAGAGFVVAFHRKDGTDAAVTAGKGCLLSFVVFFIVLFLLALLNQIPGTGLNGIIR